MNFDHASAFQRTIGWLTEDELNTLRTSRIAIAGMGGCGGSHLMTMVRMGVGRFRIADGDRFEVVNFNRQIGADMSSIGRPKARVMADMARDVNPDCHIEKWDTHIEPDEVGDFLKNVDLFMDGLDVQALDIRRRLFRECWDRGIPAVSAAPIGFGCSMFSIVPGAPGEQSFDERFPEDSVEDFIQRLIPLGVSSEDIVDPSRFDLAKGSGPSTMIGIQLCAAYAGAEAVRLLIDRSGNARSRTGGAASVYRHMFP